MLPVSKPVSYTHLDVYKRQTLGKTLGLYPDEVVLRGLYQDRELAKQGLLDALHKYGCLPKRAGHKACLLYTSTDKSGTIRQF